LLVATSLIVNIPVHGYIFCRIRYSFARFPTSLSEQMKESFDIFHEMGVWFTF
jgi:hypothetical protein